LFATPVAPVFALAASRSGTGPKRRRAAGSMSKGSARARVFDGTARGEPHYDGRKHWLFGGKHVGEIGKGIRSSQAIAPHYDANFGIGTLAVRTGKRALEPACPSRPQEFGEAALADDLRGRKSTNPRRKDVLESLQAMSLLTIMEIVGPVLLLAVLIYGTLQWSRRRRGPTQAVREASTRQLYREGAKAEKREEARVVPARRASDRSAVPGEVPQGGDAPNFRCNALVIRDATLRVITVTRDRRGLGARDNETAPNTCRRPTLDCSTNGGREERTHEKMFSHVGGRGVVGFERHRFCPEPDATKQRQLRRGNLRTENHSQR
jgi:hypothetical protein